MKIKAKIKKYNFPKSKKAKKKSRKRKIKLLRKRKLLAVKKIRRGQKSKIKIKKQKIYSQEILERYLQRMEIDFRYCGKIFRRIKRWEKIFEKLEKGIKKFFNFFFWFSYRAAIVSFVTIIIYAVSPGALSAPQSISITLKNEWEQGTLTDVYTYNTTAERDAIQLKSTGTWTARVWSPPEDIIGPGHTSVMVDNDLYVMRGYSDKAFWKFDTANSKWENMPDLPMPSYYGANMIYDQNGNIYMMFGGFSKKFYRYNIEEKTFTELAELLDTPWTGASMETDGASIYVARGNYSTDFWKYNIAEGSWSSLAATPGNVSTGGNLVNGQNGYLYLIRGGNTQSFDRYNLTTRTWDTSPADTPSTGCGGTICRMNGEQKGVYHGGYLYFFQSAGYTQFLRFSISGGTWEVLSSDAAPATVNYASLTLNQNDDLIYAFRGNGTFDFWKFDPDAAAGTRWVGPQQVNNNSNGTIGTGGDLIWNEGSGASNYIYCVRGGNTANFYRYNVSTNTWTTMPNVSYGNVNYDIKGTWQGGVMYFPRYNSTTVYTFDGSSWGTVSDLLPAVVYNGAAMTYNSGDSRIYILRGGGTQTMYYRSTSGGAWSTAANIAVADGGTTLNYYVNVGGRMVSDDTNLYIMPGDGETAFIRYNTASNNYTKLAPTPFSQWYGTDMTYNDNGKILALAGWYKNETWEYDIASDTWRRLPDSQRYTYGRGSYQGASIEFNGGTSFYATNGGGLTNFWSFTSEAANYPTIGTYESQSIDLAQVSGWTSFTKNEDTPSNTSLTYETRTSADNENWSSWEEVSGTDIQSDVNRYIQVRITLESTDGVNTPTVYDYTISYMSEDTDPINPTALTATSQQVGGVTITSGNTYAYDHPYFDWPDAETAGGATDGSGAGVEGYYVYFGTNASADPETDGNYTVSTYYLVNETLSAGTYYLRIKTKDANGNVANDAWSAFTFVYGGVSPPESLEKTTEDDFDDGTLTNISASSVSGSLRLQSKAGFWKDARLSLASSTIYIGGELTISSCAGSANHCLYTFRGYNSNTFMRYEIETDTWVSSPTTIANTPATVYWGGRLTAGPDGYLYGLRGNGTTDFWMYNITNNTWTAIDSIPKAVTYGSSLVYDGARYIYAAVGNDDAFYKYDTCNGEGICTPGWTQLENINFGNPNTSDGQRTYEGADAVYDGSGNIYMSQGNYYPYFSKYSIASDEWNVLTQMPAGPYDGGSLVYDEDNNDIYALTGKGRLSMYKYDIDSDVWTTAPDAPGTISYGASMEKYGNYIYVTRGGATNGFYRYDIAHGTWQLPQFGFFGPHYLGSSYFNYYYGTALASEGNNEIYIIRGYYDNTFGKYNVDDGLFTELARLPVGAYAGASIVYNEDENAVYYNPGQILTARSANGNYFFKYDVATNVWSQITTDPPPDKTYSGSSMAYDGSRYIYLTRGNNSQNWWRYDTQGAAGSRWSAMPVTGGAYWTDGGKIICKDGYIYATRGSGYNTSWRFNVGDGTWASMGNLPANLGSGGSLVNGGDGYLYATRGGNTSTYYRYNTSQAMPGSWETVSASVPAQVTTGGDAASVSHRNWQTTGAGTNTFADGLYSYVISSESGGTGFEESGTYESETIDLLSVYHWANLTANYELPANTSIKFETSTSSDGSSWSGWSEVSNVHAFDSTRVMSINSTAARYIKVKITFSSSDQIYSPRLDDITINYYQDITAPTNPSNLSAWDNSTKTQTIETNTWYNHATPYFEWPTAGEAGGAADNVGGSGVGGYYVYFGDNPMADPIEYQTTTNYAASNLVSGKTYYLRVQAIDNAGNPASTIWTAFIYKYDATAPTAPTDISVTPAGYTSVDNFVFLWTPDATDTDSGVAKYQYQTGGDGDVWVDITDPNIVTITIPNTEHPIGAYQSGKNTFYIRVVDNAGNTSTALTQGYYYSASAPSPPQDLTAVPEYSASNSFSFTWDQPASFVGDANKLKYYYSVNAKPTQYNTVETTAKAVGPGPFATQKGSNTFYVVAKDEAENIDYSLYASVEFTADTSNPPVPGNVQAFDTSDREAEEYSVAVKWSIPSGIDTSNFAGYAIFRSEDNTTFSEVAMTTGSAFVDTGLESKLYYYYVKSKDKTNNYSIASSTVSLTPTGRYTKPPTIVQKPSVSIQSFQATFRWATNRICSSFIEYGKTIKLGETTGQVDSVTDHEVIVKGLQADTKYFYRVKFIDVDGNIGTSEISNFTTLPPPTISEFTVSDVGLTTANVFYKTNTGGVCALKYGKGAYTNTIEETASSTSHAIKIENLESSTTYSVMADCVDGDGNAFSSDEYTFTTLRQPIVSEAQVQNKENVDIPTVEVFYKTDEMTTTLIKFKSASEGSYHNYLTNDFVMEHKATIEDLDPAKEYEMIFTGVSESGVEAVSQTLKITTRSDSRPPEIITNRAVGKVNGRGKDAQATLYIKVETNESTQVKINFTRGVVISDFDQNTAEDSLNTYHFITIPVEAGQVYSYQIVAYDEARNQTISKSNTIVVEDKKENAIEIVTNTFFNQFGWLSSLFKK